MGSTTVRIGGNATQVTVRGGNSQRVTLDRRTVAAIAGNRNATVVQPGVTPVTVASRDTVVRAGSAMGMQGPQGPAGAATFDAVAAIDLSYPRVVALDGAGNAYYPDLTNRDDVSRIAGVTAHAAVAGTAVQITTSYDFTEVAWNWAPGRLYCALTGGGITQTAPSTGAIVEVARVVSPTTIRVGIQPAILI